jgi:hypothetical protein
MFWNRVLYWFMSQDSDIAGKPAEDADEIGIATAQAQLKCLAQLREVATGLVCGLETQGENKGGSSPELSCARLGKMILQVCAMEQHVLEQWRNGRRVQKVRQTREKETAVKARVEAAVAAATAGPERLRRMDQLRGLLPKYDFSSPREMAAMVADICEALGVPFRPEIWPEGEAVAAGSDAQKAPPASESPSTGPGSGPGQALPHQGGGTRVAESRPPELSHRVEARFKGSVISAGRPFVDGLPGGLKPGAVNRPRLGESDLPTVRIHGSGRGPP